MASTDFQAPARTLVQHGKLAYALSNPGVNTVCQNLPLAPLYPLVAGVLLPHSSGFAPRPLPTCVSRWRLLARFDNRHAIQTQESLPLVHPYFPPAAAAAVLAVTVVQGEAASLAAFLHPP